MKKKITLVLIIIGVTSLKVFSQSLPNTTWTVYNTSSIIFAYFHFGTDTISRSFNNITYTDISTYLENGNNFTIVDIQPSSCSTSIGNYTFSIQNDTLDFTLISDACATGRSSVIANNYWVRLTTGVPLINSSNPISIFPNPTTGPISITNSNPIDEITITNPLGQIIYHAKPLHPDTSGVSLQLNVAHEIYFVTVASGNQTISSKVIVQL